MAKLTRVQHAAGNNGTGSTTVSAALASTAYQIGDLAIVAVTVNQTTSGEDTITSINAPTGWTAIHTAAAPLVENLGANLHTLVVVYRRSTAATVASTFTATILSRKAAITAVVLRGGDTGATPVVAGALANPNAASPNAVGPAPVNADDALLHIAAVEGVRTVAANTSGWTANALSSSSGSGGDATKVSITSEWTDSATASAVTGFSWSASGDCNSYVLQIKTATPAASFVDGAATLAGAGSVSAAGATTTSAAVTLAGTGGLAATAERVVSAAATLGGIGSIAADGEASRPPVDAAATLGGVGSLSGTPTRLLGGAATLAGAGALSAAGSALRSGGASLAGAGALSAAGGTIRSSSAVLGGVGSLAGSGVLLAGGAATLAGIGALSASAGGGSTHDAAATLAGVGSIGLSPGVIRSGTATLAGTGAASAAGARTVSAGASLAGVGAVGATPQRVAGASAVLSGQGDLAALAAAMLSGSALLAGEGHLLATGELADLLDRLSRIRELLASLLEPGAVGVTVDDSGREPDEFERRTLYLWEEEDRDRHLGPVGSIRSFRFRAVYASDSDHEEPHLRRRREVSEELDQKRSAYMAAVRSAPPTVEWDHIDAAVDHDYVRGFDVRGVSIVVSGYKVV